MFLSLFMGQLLYNDCLMGILFYFLDMIIKNSNSYKDINNLKETFIKAFKLIYDFDANNVSQNDHEQDLCNVGSFYFNHIKKFINYI